MSGGKHTPGPWNSFNQFGNRGACFASDNETMIAYIRPPYAHEAHKVPRSDVCNANFRLIDAAPDMLAALREAEGELYQVPPADAEQERVLGVVRSAIAKATGSPS